MSDFLSFSPSLVDILSYINYANLANCDLVNRRIHDVMERNRTRLSKQIVYADILVYEDKDDMRLSVKVLCGVWEKSIQVELKSNEIVHCTRNRRLTNYCEKNGQLHFSSHEGLDGIKKGLEDLLFFVFNHYFIKELTIKHRGKMEGALDMISKVVLLIPQAKVNQLDVDTSWSGLPQLVSHINPNNVVFVQGTGTLTLSKLPNLHKTHYYVKIPQDSDCVDHITDLVKKWQESGGRIKYIDILPTTSNPHSRLTCTRMARVLRELLRHSTIVHCNENGGLVMHFFRQADNMRLSLQYHPGIHYSLTLNDELHA